MNVSDIKNTFDNEIPLDLSNGLFDSYCKGLKEYSKGNWQYFINEMGQFNETVYRIIEYMITGSYTPLKNKLNNFNETILIKWENVQNVEENIRVIIPRVLYAMYCIRNKRGAIHKNDIIPNKMDANLLLSSAKWILAELYRVLSKEDMTECQKNIDSIINKEIDLLWCVEDKLRILDNNMKCCDKILIILYVNDTMVVDELIKNVEYSNKTTFKKLLKKMHNEKYIEYDNEKCTISPKGMLKAEEIILKCNTIF